MEIHKSIGTVRIRSGSGPEARYGVTVSTTRAATFGLAGSLLATQR
jgi:hypothetical protein